MYTKLDLIAAVRELMERHWDAVEIASKLRIDVNLVQSIISNILT